MATFIGFRWLAPRGWFPRATAASWFWKGLTETAAGGAPPDGQPIRIRMGGVPFMGGRIHGGWH
jgi:hypothetical protein